MTDYARFSWTVLLPVKVLARAKSRLAVLAGERRRELALALAADTVASVLACPEVARVVVVTSDPVAGPLLAALGAVVVPDVPAGLDGPGEPADPVGPGGPAGPVGSGGSGGPVGPADPVSPADPVGPVGSGEPGGPGDLGPQHPLNAALRHGAALAARRWPGTGLVALTADLPALRPAELTAALRAAGTAAGRAAFVPDAAGVGTTLYAVPPGGDFRPLFGGASRARHAASGAAEIDLDGMAGLRRDVDTPEDLQVVLALGAGPRTTALAGELLADA
jgi:2-phospho-L-lactate/phosphoenolpyruvate guanylyltransferase